MIENIYSKIQPGVLLHSTFRLKALEDDSIKRVDITDPEHFLQCAIMKLEDEKTYDAHKHKVKPQIITNFQVQETFIVLVGKILIEIYDLDNSTLEKVILNAGDLAILLAGGHSLSALNTGTVIYEIKTGPYKGQALDKEFIQVL